MDGEDFYLFEVVETERFDRLETMKQRFVDGSNRYNHYDTNYYDYFNYHDYVTFRQFEVLEMQFGPGFNDARIFIRKVFGALRMPFLAGSRVRTTSPSSSMGSRFCLPTSVRPDVRS